MKAMLTLLAEILRRKQIRWDIWFSVAACVYLGCPFKDRVMDIELGGTAYAAIQYRNLAVVAPWLDLNAHRPRQRSWRPWRTAAICIWRRRLSSSFPSLDLMS
jgi:hypothetical protein